MKNLIKLRDLGLLILLIIFHSCKKEGIPTLSTAPVINITATSASSGGNITYDGNAGVTSRGVCWSGNANPTTTDSKTTDGIGTGQFVSSLTGLTAGSTYHVRAYATNSIGTAYGSDLNFTTLPVVPTVNTTMPSSVTEISAISGGNIADDGGSTITARGVCWGTSANPTIMGEHSTDGTGTGSFTSNMKCLSFATIYYVRAYATNSAGTSYGDQQIFTTLGTDPIIFNPGLTYGSVSDMDGNCYKTIQIGNQSWMAENLKTTKYNDGTDIPLVTDNTSWYNLTTHGYCWYNNDVANKATYGAMYNWYTVNTGKLCPTGWHVPDIAEWRILCNPYKTPEYEDETVGNELMETGVSHWKNPLGTNETGFTAIPSGIRSYDGVFYSLYLSVNYWSSTDAKPYPAYAKYHPIPYGEPFGTSPLRSMYEYTGGLSVRCIKDN